VSAALLLDQLREQRELPAQVVPHALQVAFGSHERLVDLYVASGSW
jgi:hypothetical protein